MLNALDKKILRKLSLDPKLTTSVSYTHLRAHETEADLVCRLLLEKKQTLKLSKSKLDQVKVLHLVKH